MLRLINSNRMAAVGVAAAIVLVVVTMFVRFDAASIEGGPVEQPDTTASTTVNGDEVALTADEPMATTSTTVNDPERLSVPVDPSGSRGDRTEDGARQSVIDFAGTVQQRLLYLTEPAVQELLTAWSSDATDLAAIESDIDEVARLRSTLTSGGGDVWWSVTPIASQVEAFDADRAWVSVWVVQVIGSNIDPQLGGDAVAPTVDFRTTVVDLVWDQAKGWSVWNTTSTPGPVPMMAVTSTMSAPTEFMGALSEFTLTKEHS